MAGPGELSTEEIPSAPEVPQRSIMPGYPVALSRAAAPTDPPSIADVVAALRDIEALYGLADHEYHWLASHGKQRVAEDRATVFYENEAAHDLTIVLKGEIYVHRRNSGSISLFIGRTSQVTGKLPYSRMKAWGGEGSSSGSLWLLDIHESEFPAMLLAIPSIGQICVSLMLDRVRDFTRADLQAEKLTALGKLAANLSHELNNPAAAAQRAAFTLASRIDRLQELCSLGRLFPSEQQLASFIGWAQRSFHEVKTEPAAATDRDSSLSESDREEQFLHWLETHNVPNAWSVAPALATARMHIGTLDELASLISPEVLPAALTSVAVSLDAHSMVSAVAYSSGRIFSIINAIKDYSYMDQAPIQQIDLAQSIENTLALLHSRMHNITIVRDYDPSLTTITAYGAELSQVWTALIENAIDATSGHGTLKITSRLKGEMAFVEIWDDGTGVDPTLSSRIFEPFFTTKPLGQGLGLGLDIARRIVGKHFGSVSMQSAPHATCFQVRLPLDRPQIY